MNLELRDYQKEAVETVLNEYAEGIARQLLVLPTGSGKTIIMAALAKEINKKTLILAHREELISQAVDKFQLFWPEVSIGVCMAERDEIEPKIVVGSVQSCSRLKRLARLQEQNFELLMIDEAHHAAADTYISIINALGFSQSANKLLIGVSATPKQNLGEIFDKITFSRSIGTMIKAGYLSPVIGRKILTSFVFEKIRSLNGDFSIDDLAEAVNTPERNRFIVEKYKTHARDRKAIAFCCDVQHCKDLAESMRQQGIEAKAVWGDMPSDERKQVLDDLKRGKIQVATSCGVLTEGFDEPTIDAVIMARPTKSPTLYTQCIGRGLRCWPGKLSCLILDFTDKFHHLDTVMSLASTIPEAVQIKDDEHDFDREEIDKTSKIQVLDECDTTFDILGSTRFIWVSIGDNEMSLLDDLKREIVISPEGTGYVAEIYYPDGFSFQIVKEPLPLEYCSGVCEDFARRHLKIAFADMNSPWMQSEAQPTQGQRNYLIKNSAWRDGMTKAAASLEIRKIIALKNKQRRNLANEPLTDKQRGFLKSCGIETKNMSKLTAMQRIARMKQL